MRSDYGKKSLAKYSMFSTRGSVLWRLCACGKCSEVASVVRECRRSHEREGRKSARDQLLTGLTSPKRSH